MTNAELIERAEDAMRFLRTCGSDRGKSQADDIAVLCKRVRLYENKLVQFNLSTSDMMADAGLGAYTEGK